MFSISGFAASTFLLLSADPTASVIACRWLLQTTELMRRSSVFACQVGHLERGLERSHLARLVLARQELQAIIARRQGEAGVVFEAAAAGLRAVASLSFTLMPSRTLATSLPLASRIWPMKSNSVVSFEPFFAKEISEPGIFTETGTK